LKITSNGQQDKPEGSEKKTTRQEFKAQKFQNHGNKRNKNGTSKKASRGIDRGGKRKGEGKKQDMRQFNQMSDQRHRHEFQKRVTEVTKETYYWPGKEELGASIRPSGSAQLAQTKGKNLQKRR